MYTKPNLPAVAHHGPSIIGFNWIGGRELEGDLPSFESRGAVDTRDVVGIFPACGPRDVERALRAAREAFRTWSATPAPARGECVRRIGHAVEANRERLARILTREVGKTPREAMGEVQELIDTCAFYAGEGRRLQGETLHSELPSRELATFRRPHGVCGVLTPSSFPLAIPGWKLIAAILCGNTVVWKPSEEAPTAAYLLARCMMDAGLPGGVVNTVNGPGRACGQAMVEAIDRGAFDVFSFTGGTSLGRTVGEACGRNLVPACLSLGAKNPMIVMADADLDQAVQGALVGAFGTAGQRCTSLANLILHAPIAAAFREKFLAAVASMPIGNPVSHPEVAYGPLISPRIQEAFEAHLAFGREEGATLCCGGARWTEENRDGRVLGEIQKGLYMQPCVWEGVKADMRLFQEEILGPTVNLCVAESFDEALQLANGTPYGLSSALYTENRAWIEAFRRHSRAGMSSINNSTVGAEVHAPFGGTGWSGNGARETGAWALETYTRWHAVNEDLSSRLQLAQIDTEVPSAAYGATAWDRL